MKPYYEHDGIQIFHGDCREILPQIDCEVIATDPPYPNNGGWFLELIPTALDVCYSLNASDAFIFWSELEHPPVRLPLVAVHIWHRTNVNGRPYEPIYHFAKDGRKRRSEVMKYPAVFNGAGPGCHEYAGHPTQKPVVIMRQLLEKSKGGITDPFCGVGATLIAAKQLRRSAIGIEIGERYCEIAAKRLSQQVLSLEYA